MEPGKEVGRHGVGERSVAVEEEGVVVLEVPHGEMVGDVGASRKGGDRGSYTGWQGFSPDPSPPLAVEVTYGSAVPEV
jgi:hypothetical protein